MVKLANREVNPSGTKGGVEWGKNQNHVLTKKKPASSVIVDDGSTEHRKVVRISLMKVFNKNFGGR